jgi:hypothetical protein
MATEPPATARSAETERAVREAIAYGDAHPDSGRVFTSVEELRAAAEAEAQDGGG